MLWVNFTGAPHVGPKSRKTTLSKYKGIAEWNGMELYFEIYTFIRHKAKYEKKWTIGIIVNLRNIIDPPLSF